MNFENLCQICQEQSAPYKCPKCRKRYCSLTCYRDVRHGTCTKEFDENEFAESMNINEEELGQQTTTNSFVRERIQDIMKRKLDEREFHDENDDEEMKELFEHILPTENDQEGPIDLGEEGEEVEGEERIASDDDEPVPQLPDDIDESDENTTQLWTYLTTDEKREFKSMLTDGRISHLLNDYKPWKPWWLHKTQAPALVTDLERSTKENLPETVPPIETSLIPLPSLTSILPHVHVRFDLFEILFAYVLISIRYRGDFQSYPAESGPEFLHLASRHLTQKPDVLLPEHDDDDPISVLQTRVSLLREHLEDETLSLRLSEEFFVNILADISMIIHGPYSRETPANLYVLAALSDLKRFLRQISEYKPPSQSTTSKETNQPTSMPINVFHINRTVHPKVTVNRPTNSKLCIRPVKPVARSAEPKAKTPKLFNRKILQKVTHKIDYLLSWTLTHANRLLMLEFELEQIEHDRRQQLTRYQQDKTCIEKNLDRLRLQQKTLIEEL